MDLGNHHISSVDTRTIKSELNGELGSESIRLMPAELLIHYDITENGANRHVPCDVVQEEVCNIPYIAFVSENLNLNLIKPVQLITSSEHMSVTFSYYEEAIYQSRRCSRFSGQKPWCLQ